MTVSDTAGRDSPSRGPVLVAFLTFGMLWGGWAALLPSTQAATGVSKGELGIALLFVGLGSLPAPDAERGAAVATVTTLGYLGFLACPPIVGVVAQALGIRASFVLLAGAAAIVAAAAPRLHLR